MSALFRWIAFALTLSASPPSPFAAVIYLSCNGSRHTEQTDLPATDYTYDRESIAIDMDKRTLAWSGDIESMQSNVSCREVRSLDANAIEPFVKKIHASI